MNRNSKTSLTFVYCAVVLLFEVGALTPFVEFEQGLMRAVADPLLVWSGIVALAGLSLLAWPLRERISKICRRSTSWVVVLGSAHALLYCIFAAGTLELNQVEQVPDWKAYAWLGMAAAVFVSLLAVPFPLTSWLRIIKVLAGPVVVAIAIGIGFWCFAEKSRAVWNRAYGGNVVLVSWMLARFPGEPVVGIERGLPYVGTDRARILITSSCSEMESILALWLLVVGVAVGRAMTRFRAKNAQLDGPEGPSYGQWLARAASLMVVAIVGTLVLWVLNAVRFYVLILIGHASDVSWSVRLAHSRLGASVLLAVAWGMLFWWQSRQNRYEPIVPLES